MTPVNLLNLKPEEFKKFLDSFDHVFSDCDGVIWTQKALPRVGEFFDLMKKHGKTVHFVSNNSLRTKENYEEMFLDAKIENGSQCLTIPSVAICEYLKSVNFNKKIYSASCPQATVMMESHGFECKTGPELSRDYYDPVYLNYFDDDPEIGAVVLDCDFRMNLTKLNKAITYLKRPDVLFLCGATDRKFYIKKGCAVLSSAIFIDIASSEAKREPICMAKPSKTFGEFAMKRAGVTDPSRVLFIGDMSNMEVIMSESATKENIMQPATLQEAINIIKFLNTTHKQEVVRLKEAYTKQADVIKKLESNRKRELEFLSGELQKYEVNLALRTEAVTEQLAQKDLIIQKQAEQIEELTKQLKRNDFSMSVPEINIMVDSNSDSGVAFDNDDSKTEHQKPEAKTVRKCSRRFGDTISFLRRVDFSPMKYKPCNREGTKKKDEKKDKLQVPAPHKRMFQRQLSNEKSPSDDERTVPDEAVFSDGGVEPLIIRPNKMNDSMNNHFSDDGSEDTSEEIFDRVMTRSSIRRSVKANPKYKKINRTKSKLLEHVKLNIGD